MAKRAAGYQLNEVNWERESDEEGDVGVFKKASEEEIKNRPIKKAKRSLRVNDGSSSVQGGLFAGIKLHTGSVPVSSSALNSGFSLTKTGSSIGTNSAPFGKNPPIPATGLGPGAGIGLGLGDAGSGIKNISSSSGSSTVREETSFHAKSTSLVATSAGSGSDPIKDKFLTELRLLNISLSKWINRHLQENPYVDFSPVFNDYFEHFQRISKLEKTEHPSSNTLCPQQTSSASKPSTALTPLSNSSTLGTTTVKSLLSDEPGCQDDGDEEDNASEHLSEEEGGASPQDEEESGKKQTSIPSKDCLLSVRCKLFYKKESSFVDMGVGQLSVEERPSGIRLLLRNDTRLGNILLNVHLKGQVPVSQQKNNVLVVCLPNPPLSEETNEAVTYLIRVKNATLAEELHDVIKKHL